MPNKNQLFYKATVHKNGLKENQKGSLVKKDQSIVVLLKFLTLLDWRIIIFTIPEKFLLTFYFYRHIIEKNPDLKVINMNLALSSASKYFFSFSVAFYFSYAYFALKKLLVREQKSFWKLLDNIFNNIFKVSLVTLQVRLFSFWRDGHICQTNWTKQERL